jgi:hypothetical protein
VAKFELSEDGERIKITGRSKIKEKDPAVRLAEARKSILVQPVGVTAKQFMTGLGCYREHTAPHVERLDGDNRKISNYLNKDLGSVVKRLYPDQKSLHGYSGTHFTRALNFQAGFLQHGKPNESKMAFGKRQLQHKGFGALANYDAVRVQKPESARPNSMEAQVSQLKARVALLEEEKRRGSSSSSSSSSSLVPEPPVPDGTYVNPRPSKKRRVVPTQNTEFETREGNIVSIPKFKRRMRIKEDELKKRVEDGKVLLEENNVNATNEKLRKLGIGAVAVNKYYDALG